MERNIQNRKRIFETEYAQKILTRANPEIYISGLFDIIAQEYTNAKKEPQS